eukprot:7865353-Prorocentrum_lima.AAC.1
MTSSLVGSEMCIRDRLLAGLMVIVLVAVGVLVLVVVVVGFMAVVSSSSSVSYTHLTLPTICSV